MTANTPYDRDLFFSLVIEGPGMSATPWRLDFFREWARSENTGAGYNPLATTRVDYPTVVIHSNWNDNGGNPVKNYASLMDGVRATIQTLALPYYAKVRASLAAEKVLPGAGEEIRDSWGTVHYGEQLIRYAASPVTRTYKPTRIDGPPVPHDITLSYLGTWPPYYTAERPHLGIDFGCPGGTPFLSRYLNPVKVKAIHLVGDGWGDGSFGNMLVLDIEDTEYFAGFAHLSRIDVKVGQIIQHGQQLGITGDSGFTDGAHLHLQHSVDQNFSRAAKTENPLSGLGLIAAPEPIVIPPPPVVTNPHATERINYGIMLREGIRAIASRPDLADIERAADALRAAGFTILKGD